jgi:hypothetical protein
VQKDVLGKILPYKILGYKKLFDGAELFGNDTNIHSSGLMNVNNRSGYKVSGIQ